MAYDQCRIGCHPDDLPCCPMSSGWELIWSLSHPDDLAIPSIPSGRLMVDELCHPDDLAIPSISFGWLIVDALCHPDDLPGVGISSGWATANPLCHRDDILFHLMSSGLLNRGWFLIRMSYGNVIMLSGWHTFPFLSHPGEIANFDFPQHAVALQRFRTDRPLPTRFLVKIAFNSLRPSDAYMRQKTNHHSFR